MFLLSVHPKQKRFNFQTIISNDGETQHKLSAQLCCLIFISRSTCVHILKTTPNNSSNNLVLGSSMNRMASRAYTEKFLGPGSTTKPTTHGPADCAKHIE